MLKTIDLYIFRWASKWTQDEVWKIKLYKQKQVTYANCKGEINKYLFDPDVKSKLSQKCKWLIWLNWWHRVGFFCLHVSLRVAKHS